MATAEDEFDAADEDWDDWNEQMGALTATSLFDAFQGPVNESVLPAQRPAQSSAQTERPCSMGRV